MPRKAQPVAQSTPLLLYDELLLGNIPLSGGLGPKDVWDKYKNNREFQGMVYGSTFTRRLRDLRAAVARDYNQSLKDREALVIAIRNHPAPDKNHRGEPQ